METHYAAISSRSRTSDEKILCDVERERSAAICSGGSSEVKAGRATVYSRIVGLQ
jgi:hypothetical protein